MKRQNKEKIPSAKTGINACGVLKQTVVAYCENSGEAGHDEAGIL